MKPSSSEQWPPGASHMAHAVRIKDWALTSLGPSSQWSASLRSAVCAVLDTPAASMLLVGERLVQIHNDAFRPLLGQDGKSVLGCMAHWSGPGSFLISEQAISVVRERGVPASFILWPPGQWDGNTPDEPCLDMSVIPSRDAHGLIQGVLIQAHSRQPRLHFCNAFAAPRRHARHATGRPNVPIDAAQLEHNSILATLAQELWVSLTALGAVNGLLARPGIGDLDLARYQAIIDRQVCEMTRLIEDGLDAVRVMKK